MKLASTVFSWLGGIATIVFEFIMLSTGTDATRTYYYYNYSLGYSIPYTTKVHVDTPGWLWALISVFAFAQLIILIWRQVAIMNGKKNASGVCTLLFCSRLGGILTLCIPEDELY